MLKKYITYCITLLKVDTIVKTVEQQNSYLKEKQSFVTMQTNVKQ